VTAATTQDLRAVVYLARRVRKGIGARQWTEDELMKELAQYVGYDLGTVVDFVNRGARDKGLQRASGLHKGSHRTEPPVSTPFVPQTLESTERCSICSMSQTACRIRHTTDDHEFESVAMAAKRRAEAKPEELAGAVAALKAEVAAAPVQETCTGLEAMATDKPELKARLDALIENNPGLRGEPMREGEMA
jgi:hypothetical protein